MYFVFQEEIPPPDAQEPTVSINFWANCVISEPLLNYVVQKKMKEDNSNLLRNQRKKTSIDSNFIILSFPSNKHMPPLN